ncbi:hypothetical protein [uncultured Megasphaera sp.]|uniref:hypothetical protein n=1 Tax=uncultured Megasphaera sp. TaxID=165188 RepID=UPI00261AE48B|nr:hypothetical protein [uncultured Megasphaera sp.]
MVITCLCLPKDIVLIEGRLPTGHVISPALDDDAVRRRTAAFPAFHDLPANHGRQLPLFSLVMQSDGLEGKTQGCREQAGSDKQTRQTVGQEKEAIGLRRCGCARSVPPRR